jgi:phosphatidylglycerol:prolipoprotein diacylglycerol transferase
MGGKTIVGALIFGLLTVEFVKRYIGLNQSTGDLYAIPLSLGIAIGRIGCFLTGLSDNTYGIPTSLPWGINFGDGIPRHPTQLYEIIFLLALIPLLYHVLQKTTASSNFVIPSEAASTRSEDAAQSRDLGFGGAATGPARSSLHASRFVPGDAFKLFMIAYLTFRLLIDFIKPYPRLHLGLQGIQWACLFTLLYYSSDIGRWLRGPLTPRSV